MYALHLYLNISENVEFAQRVYELPESCFHPLLYEGRLRFQHHSIAVKPLSVPSTLHTPSQTSHFCCRHEAKELAVPPSLPTRHLQGVLQPHVNCNRCFVNAA